MNLAYLFTFFLVILIALFLLLPFFRQDKSTFSAEPQQLREDNEDIPLDLGRDEAGAREMAEAPASLAEYEMEIEIAVTRARRHKSTFSCSHCGHRMQPTDRFCAACGQPCQSS
jgi:hypothetical protein